MDNRYKTIGYSKEITETGTAIQSLTLEEASDRNKWLAERRKGIGGSDVAAILGMSPWTTRSELWAEKTGRWPEKDISASPFVRFGVDNEDKVATLFAEQTGKKVYATGHFHRKDALWMHASPDRLIFDEAAGLECKTTSSAYAYEWEAGSIPDQYFCQVQWYMAVMGFSVWYIACLFRDTGRFIWRRIERNDAFIAYMENKASYFWGLVQTGTLPPDDGTGDYMKLLQDEFGCAAGTFKHLNKSAIELCKVIITCDMEMKKLKAKKQAAMNKLARQMGDAETGFANGFVVRWQKGRAKNKYKVIMVGKKGSLK